MLLPIFGLRPYESQCAAPEGLELVGGIPPHLPHPEDPDGQLIEAPVIRLKTLNQSIKPEYVSTCMTLCFASSRNHPPTSTFSAPRKADGEIHFISDDN